MLSAVDFNMCCLDTQTPIQMNGQMDMKIKAIKILIIPDRICAETAIDLPKSNILAASDDTTIVLTASLLPFLSR